LARGCDSCEASKKRVSQGFVSILLGHNGDAIADFRRAIEMNPRDTIAYANLGVVLGQLGKVDDAFHSFQMSLDLNPSYVYAYFSRAGLYASLSRYREAIDDYEKVLAVNPSVRRPMSGTVYAQTEEDMGPIYLVTYHDCGLARISHIFN
jgi:tetratricopeptide (TPR) repeat protein